MLAQKTDNPSNFDTHALQTTQPFQPEHRQAFYSNIGSVVLSRFLHPTTVRTPHQPVKTRRPAQNRAKPTAAHPPIDPSQPKGP